MPTSEKRLAANRANALRSTGPHTPAGKAIASRNAIKHGIFATDLLASGAGNESSEEFDDLIYRLTSELDPQGLREEVLVSQIAVQYWRLRRVYRTEAADIEDGRTAAVAAWERKHDPAQHIKDLSLGDEIEFYGPALAEKAREALASSPGGLDYSLAVLRGARNEIERTGSLCAGGLRLLIHLLGEEHDLVALARAVLRPAGSATPAIDVTIADLAAALDSCINDTTVRCDLAQQHHDAARSTLLAKHSLPVRDAADKILRYEKLIQNALYRAMSELDRLQACRLRRRESQL